MFTFGYNDSTCDFFNLKFCQRQYVLLYCFMLFVDVCLDSS